MAPEQINEGKVDARTDLYALGVIFYECLTGRIPFDGDTNITTMMQHCNMPLPPMKQKNPNAAVPEAVEAIVRHMLEKDPANRPQSMDAFIKQLSALEESLYGANVSGANAPLSGPVSANTLEAAVDRVSRPDAMAISGAQQMTAQSPGVVSSGSHPAASTPSTGRPSGPPTGTHRSLTRSQFPDTQMPLPAKRGTSPLAIVLALVIGVGLIAAVGLFVLRSQTHASSGSGGAASSSASTGASYTLTIESTPSGAEVRDGDKVLGSTPLSLPIDRATVQREPRKFVVHADGYAPHTLYQGDSESSVRVVAVLEKQEATKPPATTTDAPDTSASTAKPPVYAGRNPPPPPATTTAAQTTSRTPPPPPNDIKLSR
jgi:serine/threonine-protein kinase